MGYFTVETWEMIRDIIGLLICLISVLCLMRRKSAFHHTLHKELTKKTIKAINKRLLILKQQNDYTRQLVKKWNPSPLEMQNIDIENGTHKNDKKKDKFKIIERDPSHSKPKNHIIGTGDLINPYEALKPFIESGMNQDEIFNKTNLPRAEIDFMLKFNRLTRLAQLKKQGTAQRAAY